MAITLTCTDSEANKI